MMKLKHTVVSGRHQVILSSHRILVQPLELYIDIGVNTRSFVLVGGHGVHCMQVKYENARGRTVLGVLRARICLVVLK